MKNEKENRKKVSVVVPGFNKIPAPRANKYCVGSQGLATKRSGWG